MSTHPSAQPKSGGEGGGLRRLVLEVELRDLELFVSVAEAGSITHGAKRAHLSLPAASARLQAMERAIGAALLNRGRRGVTLTPAGQLLREHATTLLAQVERMRGDLTRFAEGLVASVRLQANTAASETFLPGQLVAFLRQRPEIDIDLRERPSARIVHALARGHTDLGIVASSVDTGSLICEPLIDDYLVLAVPRGHELEGRPRVAFADCMRFPLIGLGEGRALADHLDQLARPHSDRPLHRVRLPSLAAVCTAVTAGLGVAVVPKRVGSEWQSRGELAMVGLDEPWANRKLLICRAPNTQLSAAGRDLHAYLTAASHGGG
ncbi:MAG TPA: LysR family transcriptional regulator [Solirubrobacteraceae bacterium]|nr:LysR family transcriptional regulator [Solirubrobacteraceae bacterium]